MYLYGAPLTFEAFSFHTAGELFKVSLLVVGSVAFDAVETPFGKRERMLGGSATHFGLSASFFTDVRVVGVVGGDFGEEEMSVFRERGINTDDLERVEAGKTFFWSGRYDFDLNTAHTLDTQLNVFADFKPKLSDESKGARMVFLGNIQPELQIEVREQVRGAELVALDTMNYWITTVPEQVEAAIRGVDVVIINDAEARQLSKEPNLIKAARKILSWGRRARATPSPAASWATSQATSGLTTTRSGAPSSSARSWPPSTSRSSAPTASAASPTRRSTS